jgi:hypothetical protein
MKKSGLRSVFCVGCVMGMALTAVAVQAANEAAKENRGTILSGTAKLSSADGSTTAIVGQWAQSGTITGGSVKTSVGIWTPVEEATTSTLPERQRFIGNNKIHFVANEMHWNFSLSSSSMVSVKVYTVDGTLVTTLLQQQQSAGTHSWVGQLPNELIGNSVYIVRFESAEFFQAYRFTGTNN